MPSVIRAIRNDTHAGIFAYGDPRAAALGLEPAQLNRYCGVIEYRSKIVRGLSA
jgi:hypothetical protein